MSPYDVFLVYPSVNFALSASNCQRANDADLHKIASREATYMINLSFPAARTCHTQPQALSHRRYSDGTGGVL
jgi:hypothetical protein